MCLSGRTARVLALACILATSPLTAAEWSLNGRITERLTGESNLALDDGEEANPTFRSTTNLRLTLTGRTPRTNLRLSSGFNLNYLEGPGAENFDFGGNNRVNPNLTGNVGFRGKGWNSGLNFNVVRTPTAFNDFIENFEFFQDIDDIDDDGDTEEIIVVDDSFTARVDSTQTRIRIGGNFGFPLTSNDQLTFAVNSQLRRFDDETENLVPTTSLTLSVGWGRRLTAERRIGLRASYTRFTSDDVDDRLTETFSFGANYGTVLSPRSRVGGSIGVTHQRSQRDVFNGIAGVVEEETTSTTGLNGAFNFTHLLPTGQLTFNAQQNLNATAAGDLRTVTTFTAGYAQPIVRRLNFNIRVGYSLRPVDGAFLIGSDGLEQFFNVSPTLRYRLSRNWNSTLGYRFRFSDEDDGFASSNAVFVSFSRGFSVF